jgi:hypothetical protein
MAKYHGNGNPNSPIVQLQLHGKKLRCTAACETYADFVHQHLEITEDFAQTRNDNPWWDFRELGNTKAARYRLYMVIAMAFFGQWSGNNVVSYFMPAMVPHLPSTQLITGLT